MYPIVAFLFVLSAGLAQADQFFRVDPQEHLKDGAQWPENLNPKRSTQRDRARVNSNFVRVTMEKGGVGYFVAGEGTEGDPYQVAFGREGTCYLILRVPDGVAAEGQMFLPGSDVPQRVKFSVPAGEASKEAKLEFLKAAEVHDRFYFGAGVTGAAWFRHRMNERREEIGEGIEFPPPRFNFRRRGDGEFEETVDLFSGGRALSENLQLDRELRLRNEIEGDLTAIHAVEGVTIAGIDWKPFIKGADPKKDHLASVIPHDQHAVFFPSFKAMVTMADQSQAQGSSFFQLLTRRSEDAAVRERYEKQLCMELDGLTRLTGGALIKAIAFTGSDPYLRTGSDVAVLFHSTQADALEKALRIRQKKVAEKFGAEQVVGAQVGGGFTYEGFLNEDRSVSSFICRLSDEVVAVSNSSVQLEILHSAATGKETSLDELDEFTFFRDRYPLGDEEETAFAVLSDSTIRRWCSPRWRIGASRRTRVAAALSELQSRALAAEANDKKFKMGKELPRPVRGMGKYRRLGDNNVGSYGYGSLEFLTPIRELKIDKVSAAEKQAYEAFRRGYQRNWTNGFDPIAVRFSIKDDQLDFDLTVRPLIGFSDYRDMMGITAGGQIKPGAGMPHENSLLHLVAGIDKNNPMFGSANSLLGEIGPNPFGWLGSWISLSIDKDPIWEVIAESAGEDGLDSVADEMLEENLGELPIVLMADVGNPFKLIGFLTGVRGLVQSSAPGMSVWTNEKHNEIPFVKIGLGEEASGQGLPDDLALYYVSYDRKLVYSFSRKAIERTIDRLKAGKEARLAGEAPKAEKQDEKKEAAPATELKEWKGEHVALHARELQFLELLFGQSYLAMAETRSWNHLPILNQWKLMFPDEDPVEVHERIWKVRPLCPAGGEYRWNDDDQTMESSVLGHPGRPVAKPAFRSPIADFEEVEMGITFEEDGLRAKGGATLKR